MGEYAIRMPDIGEGIAEAELIEWLVGVGDEVAADAPLAEVTTDKARVQIPSPVTGTVMSLGAQPGEFVAVGAELIRLHVAGGGNTASAQTADNRGAGTSGKVLAAPAVRGRARDAGVDLGDVSGTGPEGRVTAADLKAHLGRQDTGKGRTRGARDTGTHEVVEDIRLMGIRRMTAKRVQQAWREVPHITIVEELDVTELEALRTLLNADVAEGDTPRVDKHGESPRLTVLAFLIRAIVRAVREQPQFNAHFDEQTDTIRQFSAVHVGIATQAPDGLKVPVVRHADTLDLWQAGERIAEVSGAVRDGRASREELTGSTITITSLGKLGALATTPIVNRPEVAIVGVNRMAVRPMWNGTEFVPRTMMNLSSSFDHRVIDGWEAATFIARLKQLIETPALLFLESPRP